MKINSFTHKKGRPTKMGQLQIQRELRPYFEKGISASVAAEKTRIDKKTVNRYFDNWAEEMLEVEETKSFERQEMERVRIIASYDYLLLDAYRHFDDIDEQINQLKKEKKPEPLVIKTVKSILDLMSKKFSQHDNLLKSQGRIPIYYLLFREGKNQGKLQNISRQKIMEFNKKVENNKKQAQIDLGSARADLLEYDRLTIQGTNDASSIRARFQIIARYFHIDPTEIVKLS